MAAPISSRLLRKHLAIPSEHGAWIWWIGPLVIGAFAGGEANRAIALLAVAALALFLLRQPATIAVKAISKRRPRADLVPALVWVAAYATIALASLLLLVTRGHSRLLWLGLPAALVFGWHLALVSRREERGQMGVELVGAGVLALTAPGGYWVAGGAAPAEPWILWALTWLQSAASIVYVYLRLRQRRMERMPEVGERWRMGARALAYHGFNLIAGLALAAGGLVPWTFPLAFAVMALDALEGVAHPPVGARPARIGLRQLAASGLFIVIVLLGYLP